MTSDSLFGRFGWLPLGEEGDALVGQSYTRNTLLGYMGARRIGTASSILLLMTLTVHLAIEMAVTRFRRESHRLLPKEKSSSSSKENPAFSAVRSCEDIEVLFPLYRKWKRKWLRTSTHSANLSWLAASIFLIF